MGTIRGGPESVEVRSGSRVVHPEKNRALTLKVQKNLKMVFPLTRI